MVAVTDPSLSLYEADTLSDDFEDQRPEYRLTCFALYDENGHMISIDDSMMERLGLWVEIKEFRGPSSSLNISETSQFSFRDTSRTTSILRPCPKGVYPCVMEAQWFSGGFVDTKKACWFIINSSSWKVHEVNENYRYFIVLLLMFFFVLGDTPIIGISSDIAHYFLLEAHPLYAPVSWPSIFFDYCLIKF